MESESIENSSISVNNSVLCADQVINDVLEGLSGRIAWGIVQIILMCLGNIGNILTLIVLNRRLMRKGGVNNLLQGLAISDIMAPTLACIPNILYYYGPKDHTVFISFINSFVMPVATGATFCSNWIVVTITCFRLMIVVKPLYSQIYCSSRNERRALILIFLLSILSIIPYYYHLSMKAQSIMKVVSAIVSLLCPWVICIFLWILLIRIVNREIGVKVPKQFTLHSEVIAQRLKSKSRITKMVLIICFCNIICQLPVLILTIVGLTTGNPCGQVLAITYVGLLFLSNLLLIVNHSINFFIYSLTNCKFRYTLKIMCRHCCLFRQNRGHRKSIQRPAMSPEHKNNLPGGHTQTPKYEWNTWSYTKGRENLHYLASPRAFPKSSLYVCRNCTPQNSL